MITLNDTKRGTLSSGPVETICQWHGHARKATHKRGVQESAYLTQKIRCYSQQPQQNKGPCRAMSFNLRHTENEIHRTKFCTYSLWSPNSLNVISLLESLQSFCKHIMWLLNTKCRLVWESCMLCVFVRFCFGVVLFFFFWLGFILFLFCRVSKLFCLIFLKQTNIQVTVCAQDNFFLLLEEHFSITLRCISAIEDDVWRSV